MRKTTGLFFAAILLPVMLAGYEGTLIGGEPYEKWEKGGNDYFVLFNSLIDDQVTLYGEGENRQPDTCINESSFTLSNFHTPDDAIIAKAYLVWMGAVDPTKFAAPTDNAVFLNFTRYDSNYTHSEEIIAGDEAKMLGDTTDPFLFQSVRFNTDITTGCTETEAGTTGSAELAYFTYRADITPFFQKIVDDNHATEEPILDGDALYGAYTVSGLDCTDHDNYKCRGMMVSNWSLVMIYQSGKVRETSVYLYPGFASMQGETTTANVSGFALPKNPIIRLTTMIAGGDATVGGQQLPPELIYIRGQNAVSTYHLTNECNPYVAETMSYEIYNNVSSIYGWDPTVDYPEPLCVTGGYEEQKQGVDVDTFLLKSEEDINLQEHLQLDNTALDVTLSVNQDAILTNFLIVSVDTKSPAFDIPPEATDWPQDREKHICSCRAINEPEEVWCYEKPMYFLIKVQNWGTNIANNVVVVDKLDPFLTYFSGTTEMATRFDAGGNGVDWQRIDDLPGDGSDPNTKFPLSGAGYKVADTMDVCNRATWTCKDTRLIRFKVVRKDLSVARLIENLATIKEEGSDESQWYHTNRNFPLKLPRGQCGTTPLCPHLSIEDCGGEPIVVTDDDDIVTPDDDAIVPDETTTDTETPDTDTKKDGGCGCSLVF